MGNLQTELRTAGFKESKQAIQKGMITGMTLEMIGDGYWQASVSYRNGVYRGMAVTAEGAVARCKSLATGVRPKPPSEYEVHQGEQNVD